MAARIFACRNEEEPSVLYALEFAFHDPSFGRISLVVRRIDREHCGLDVLDIRLRIVVPRRVPLVENVISVSLEWCRETFIERFVGRFTSGRQFLYANVPPAVAMP